VRIPVVLPESFFSPAELSALRLDGDCFALGDGTVPLDSPVDAALRAASLRSACAGHDLVVAGWSAAWVHGVLPELRRPLTLCIDVAGAPRTRALATAPREVRFEPGDLVRLGGVRVTTPLRTAVELARHEAAFEAPVAAVVQALLALAGLSPTHAAALAARAPQAPHKVRAVERLRSLAA
jgi:hypothetical protein